ncbi:MAG TPA: hypothetical protein VFV88_02190 [Steroidobacteraceae bacterium]|nr:hypothetical protein [Steroidobacteraceae bacterium]
MKQLENAAGMAIAALLGAAAIRVLLMIRGGPCSAAAVLMYDPIAALLSTPPEYLASHAYGLDGCETWPSRLETWLFLWLPVLAATLVPGFLAARLARKPSITRGSIAGAAALVMNGFLELPVYSEMDLFLTRSEPLTSGQGAILLVLAIAGALMGASGALLFRKYRSPVHHGGSLQNLERMEKMVDEPERRLGG